MQKQLIKKVDHSFDDDFYQKYVTPQTKTICEQSGKVGYKTKTQAKKARKTLEKRYNKFFRVYDCPLCGEIHLATVENKYKKNQ